MSMGKENWPELEALTSVFSVELPGIEPEPLPGNMPPELRFRFNPLHFGTSRYLRFSFQVLTASRAGEGGPHIR
jgi:hypothetical protein